MKIYIGPYTNWIGPYQIAEKILFWMDKNKDERVHKFGEFLAHGLYKKTAEDEKRLLNSDLPTTWLYKLCNWIESKKKRKVLIRIDRYDTWNMGDTLALIILPMLKQLKKDKHGSPYVDDDDVPELLRSTNAPPKENEWDIDDMHHARWDYVIDEMIWAFEQLSDPDHEEKFSSGECDYYFEKLDEKTYNPISGKMESLSQMKEGPKHTFKTDYDALKKHHERIQNGTRLFGKYFQNLWD